MTTQSRSSSMATVCAITCAAALASCVNPQAQEFRPPDPSSIDAGEVRRIISVLADDDMRGRRAFTEDAERAAAFLALEFEAAGLAPLGDAQDYLQRFPRVLAPDRVVSSRRGWSNTGSGPGLGAGCRGGFELVDGGCPGRGGGPG